MRLLVTGAFAWTEEELNKLKELGHEVVFMQQEKNPLPCEADFVEGIIGNGIFLSHSIDQFVNLRYIQLTSAGYDRVPMEYVREKGIKIFNARGVYSIPMAEMAVCGVLQLYKDSRAFFVNQTKHRWEKRRGIKELCNKTVGIIGCGNVGNECAKRFGAFGCRILGVNVSPYKSDYYEKMTSLDEIDRVLSQSDIVILTLPITKETEHMINAEKLRIMKDGSVLVSIARGAVVDTKALEASLKTHLLGAVMDVFEEEPLSGDSPLWNMDNVIITPHNSFVGEGNHKRMCHVIYRNLEAMR